MPSIAHQPGIHEPADECGACDRGARHHPSAQRLSGAEIWIEVADTGAASRRNTCRASSTRSSPPSRWGRERVRSVALPQHRRQHGGRIEVDSAGMRQLLPSLAAGDTRCRCQRRMPVAVAPLAQPLLLRVCPLPNASAAWRESSVSAPAAPPCRSGSAAAIRCRIPGTPGTQALLVA